MELVRTANAGILLKLDGKTILLDGVCREVKPYPATPPETRAKLMESYPDIRFSHEVETLPIGLRNEARFHNQVARFQADATIEEVRLRLKHIEQLAGRNSADKQREIIRLDIDLLQADDQVLKPQDMAREWMKELLDYLTTNS